MGKIIDYYYGHISPWAFLGHDRLIAIAAETGATIAYHPISVSDIFPKTGGVPVAKRSPERRAYRMQELKRWSAYLGIPITFEPKHFPVDDHPSQYVALAAADRGADLGSLSRAIMAAVWQEERDISDWQTLSGIASAQGLDGPAIVASAQAPAMAETALKVCEDALAAGMFGAPWYCVDGETFWGQDRLPMLADRLK
ncbi:2-hydroxychromene-2-carboxylate isomerase [Rhodospirillaceae bacterium KN72]|uniref:2-hydroxychromene-2-carboxylate isomerase n=1 Tax=Pacificispira spongiicola TaxID=2729598 RepID=A0A7Y0HEB3_9PROT|nr:2-hydroxychromene-2-carboxylate isomerase [Pacificispira spongiicola]NMM44676.1 2-hydroxychromene-2-carboxylate isomerase [Pacificispira spongiicola]